MMLVKAFLLIALCFVPAIAMFVLWNLEKPLDNEDTPVV